MFNDDPILNQLPPIEDETIYSYLSRIGACTGLIILGYQPYSEYLFGTKRLKTPNYYLCDCLDNLIKRIGNNEFDCLSSSGAIIMNMTVFPFYSHFISRNISSSVIKELLTDTPKLNSVARKLKIFTLDNQIERNQVIKFCPECIKEQIYLNREHMVIGNYMCYKHRIPLNYIVAGNNSRYPKFINILSLDYTNGLPCINNSYLFYNHVADFVHSIFMGDFSDSLETIKDKIKYKLENMDFIVDETINFQKLNNEFTLYRELFKGVINENAISEMVFRKNPNSKNIMPIHYIYF